VIEFLARMVHFALCLLVLLCCASVVAAQSSPRTANLRLKFSGDGAVNENFQKVDNCFGGTLGNCITQLRLGGIQDVDGVLTVFNSSNSIHSFGVWSDNGTGGTLQRFIVENTAGGDGVTDVNFRNATVNYGSDDSAVSANGVSAFWFSPLGTSAYHVLRVYDDGEDAQGDVTLTIGNQGNINSFGRGKASQIFKICDFSDQSAANCRFILTEDGAMLWGGGSSQDVTLSRSAAGTLRVSAGDAIGSAPSNTPPTCAAAVEGAMYYDDSMSEPCFCDGTNWVTFDGTGGTPSSTSCG
jgi:hypothetical protein